MGSCQNYGPSLGTLNIRYRIIIGIQKGTIILTTTHIVHNDTPISILRKTSVYSSGCLAQTHMVPMHVLELTLIRVPLCQHALPVGRSSPFASFSTICSQGKTMGRVKLFRSPEYTSKQPKDPVVPKLPITGILLGSSKSGKTVALISMILKQISKALSI